MSPSPLYTPPPLHISVDTSMPFNFTNTTHAEDWDFNPGINSELHVSSSGSPLLALTPALDLRPSQTSDPTAPTSASTLDPPATAPSASAVALPPNYIPPSSVSSSRSRSPNHVPRPRNAFMIFRSSFLATQQLSTSIERDHRHISRIIAHCWNDLPAPEKASWRAAAEAEKVAHAEKYPGYRFSPVCRTGKPIRRNVKRNGAGEMERCKQVAALILAGKKGGELEDAVKGISITDQDVVEASSTRVTAGDSANKKKKKGKGTAKPANPRAMSTENNQVRGWAPDAGSYEDCRIPIFHDSLLAPPEMAPRIASPSPSRYRPYEHVPRRDYHDYSSRSQSPVAYDQHTSSSSITAPKAQYAPKRAHQYEPSTTHSPSPSPSYPPHYAPAPTGYDLPNDTPSYAVEYDEPQEQSSQRYDRSPTRRSQLQQQQYTDRPIKPSAVLPNLNHPSPLSYNAYPTPTHYRYTNSPYQHPTSVFPTAPASNYSSSAESHHSGGTMRNGITNLSLPPVTLPPIDRAFFAQPYVPSRPTPIVVPEIGNNLLINASLESVPTRESVYLLPWEDGR